MKWRSGLIALALLCSPPAHAEEGTLESDVVRRIRASNGKDHFITFNHENDLLASGRDQNYTSGARVTYYSVGTPMPDFMHAVDRALPTFRINETTSVYYSLGQNIYTPRDISSTAQDPDDRPWAGFLYGSIGLNTITRNHVDDVELTAGVVGPAALGEQTQKFVHKHISSSPKPRGWGNQLRNEPALMLSWERSWPDRYGFEKMGWHTTMVPHLGATAGNVYTYGNAGISFRLGTSEEQWQDDPVRVRPAMPGTGAFFVPPGKIGWHFFGGLEARAVARNIFLDGNTFRDSPHVKKNPLVADVSGGLALSIGQARVSYAAVYRTPEFEEQGKGDVFGTVTVGFRF